MKKSNNPLTKEEYLSCAGLSALEAAKKIGCSPNTIYDAPRRLKLPRVIRGSSRRLLNKEDISAYISETEEPTVTGLCERTGVGRGAVYNAIKRHGFSKDFKISPIINKKYDNRESSLTVERTYKCMYGCGHTVTKTVSVESNRGMRFGCSNCLQRVANGGEAYHANAVEEEAYL